MRLSGNIADCKILVVDSVASLRSMIKAALHEDGFAHIHEATTGAQALTMMKKKQIDLVLCDWNMPDMGGLELLKIVRSPELKDELKDITFIMMTAATDKEEVKEAISMGVSDFIVKPFSPDILNNKIIENMKKKASRSGT